MEQLRRMVRGVLGWDSWLYRRGSRFLGWWQLMRSEGAATASALGRLGQSTGGAPEALRFARLDHPFYLRAGTKDISVAINNFVREEYGAIAPVSDPKVLLDGGAYIGDTSAYFLSKYKGLRSIALEPMADSRELATRNFAPYGDRAELWPMALTSDGAPVRMSGVETGARASDDGEIEVPSISIPQILEKLPEGRIDILKMDIEGAEGPIFSDAPERWLPHVGCIIVETHGPEITDTVLGALKANGWSARQFRNLYFCEPKA